jgi:hypothetical protein
MKLNKRLIWIVFITAVLLAASVFPAAAEAEKIPVSGQCFIIAYPPWFGELEQHPDYRIWFPNDMEFYRYQLIHFYCDFSDDRLDGYFLGIDHRNIFINGNGAFQDREFGHTYSADAEGNITDLWFITGIGYTDSEGNWVLNMKMNGIGVNQGLHAKLSWTTVDYNYFLEGELLDTNK